MRAIMRFDHHQPLEGLACVHKSWQSGGPQNHCGHVYCGCSVPRSGPLRKYTGSVISSCIGSFVCWSVLFVDKCFPWFLRLPMRWDAPLSIWLPPGWGGRTDGEGYTKAVLSHGGTKHHNFNTLEQIAEECTKSWIQKHHNMVLPPLPRQAIPSPHS